MSVVLVSIVILWFVDNNVSHVRNGIDYNILEQDLDIVSGLDSAPLTIFMYSNYNCHFCNKFIKETYPQLKSEYIDKGELRFVIKLVDITNDYVVVNSLKLAVCINEFGNIEPLNRLLIADSKVVYTKEFNKMVEDFIEDDIFMAECMISGIADDYISNNLLDFKRLKLTGTPTFIINNHIYKGYKDFTSFRKIVEKELKDM